MLDFAEEQEQTISGAIPKGSIVRVKLNIRKPAPEWCYGDYFFKSPKGLLGLDAEYEVISGLYVGRKIWECIWLTPGHQNIRLNPGQITACNIGGARVKAILKAARNTETNLSINDWLDLNGLVFGVVVGLKNKPNKKGYWNNTIAKIVTPKMNFYADVMRGAEFISDGPTEGVAPMDNGWGDAWPEQEDFDSGGSGVDDVPF